MQELLYETLTQAFEPKYLKIENESYKHNVPKGFESHFKVIIAAQAFNDVAIITRHKLIYAALKEQLKSIHALSINAYSLDENIEYELQTPNCAKKAIEKVVKDEY